MTQEEAKEILREVHENSVFSVRTALETFFPEFKHRVIYPVLRCAELPHRFYY